MISVIIPAKNEVYLERTIRNVLDNATGDIEIIAELDGYLPDPPIHMNDNRVRFIHHKEGIGQRQCINHGASVAKGEFVMKLDAHCAVGKGFDTILAKDCQYDWTMIPRMYNLDHETWQPKTHKLTDYMKIDMTEDRLLRAGYYGKKEWRARHRNARLIDDTMCCMGPCFFMHKARFWELGGCDENHGGWGQQGVEVACKAWLSGGALKVNKKTWFAHWFRGGTAGFPYHITGNQQEAARTYSRDVWLKDKWPKAKQKFSWLVDKFNAQPKPIVQVEGQDMDLFKVFYNHIIKGSKNIPKWRGVPCIKLPTDLILYAQVIQANKPDIIIECGTGWGGSTLFLADTLETTGRGQVISIDKAPLGTPPHPRITYILGRMTAVDTLEKVNAMIQGQGLGGEPVSVMVILDGDHHRVQVKRELHHYGKMVTKGQFMVVEDIYRSSGLVQEKGQAGEAVDWFFRTKWGKSFERTKTDKQFLYCISKGGWLRKT